MSTKMRRSMEICRWSWMRVDFKVISIRIPDVFYTQPIYIL